MRQLPVGDPARLRGCRRATTLRQSRRRLISRRLSLALIAATLTALPPLAPDHSPGLKSLRIRNGQVNTFTISLPKGP